MRTLTSLIFFLFLFNLPAQAQNCPTILFEDVTGAQGDTVIVDVYLSDFPSFLGLQGTINYDPAVLSFVDHITGELLGPNFTFATNEPVTGTGQILISGTSFDGLPRQDYMESNVLFSLVFVIEGGQGSSSAIVFDDSFIAIQLINDLGVTGFCDIIDGSISTTAQAQNCPIVTLEDKIGFAGDTIIMDMYLSGISPLQGFQGTIVYDPAVLTFISIEEGDVGSDVRLSANESVTGSGEVSLFGFQDSADEINTFNETALLAKLAFVVEGASGSSSDIVFDNTAIDVLFVSDAQSGSDEAVCAIINGSITVEAQSQDCPVILIEDIVGEVGDTVAVDVYLSGMTTLLGVQGTFNYDPSL